MSSLYCIICDSLQTEPERATVASNVRAFRTEPFPLWRCLNCRSIHAAREVDLHHYYDQYPFHRQTYGRVLAYVYNRQVRRLRKLGFGKASSLLDFGCGSGLFVEHLQRRGFAEAHGFDEFSTKYGDRRVLKRRYDFVTAQDVLEHSPDPLALLSQMVAVTRPGGVVVIGTPNAAAIDLTRPDDYLHALHQPYHRHIFSTTALITTAVRQGWTVKRYYDKAYADTPLPGMNQRFGMFYGRAFDNTLDLAFEPPRFSWRFLTPRGLGLALFGYLLSSDLDVTVAFRTPPNAPPP